MDNEAAFRTIVEGVQDGLRTIAERTGAAFTDASSETRPTGAPAFLFRLSPAASGAAMVEVMPDHAYSTYIGVGVGGWIEVFTSPKDPAGGVANVLEIVEAMVAGRLRER